MDCQRCPDIQEQLPPNRGWYYNHSGYADFVITGLAGVRPAAGNALVIHPLIPSDKWSYFALDALPYHGHLLTVIYDKMGDRYHRGAGLTVLCDGRTIGHDESLGPIIVVLPEREKATVYTDQTLSSVRVVSANAFMKPIGEYGDYWGY